jgi:hypothetical protein
MPLQMHRQQNLLHDVLDVGARATRARQPAPDQRPQRRRDLAQHALIGLRVAGFGGAHQIGPTGIALAHARSFIVIRSRPAFVTRRRGDHAEFIA